MSEHVPNRLPLKADNLVVGKVYTVWLDDCCVGATFTAKLTIIGPDDDTADWSGPALTFDNGVEVFLYGQAFYVERES